MREDILRKAEEELEQRRLNHEQEEQRRLRKIQEEEESIAKLIEERQSLVFGSLRGILKGEKAAEDLPEKVEKVSAGIREALCSRGYPEDYLAPVEDCPDCHDSGYVGEPVRHMCRCLEKLYQEMLRVEIGLGGDRRETFENYDETLFPAEPEEGRTLSQRQGNLFVRKQCEKWADTWPEQKPRDLVLSGKSGVGKTFFLHAMAARLIERGCQVLLISAYSFLEIARKDYLDQEEGMRDLMDTEVLMIDDLGSEPLMRNITIEQLFSLINERQRRNLPTVISTNLNEQELRERYTERIVSRLTDRSSCLFIPMEGRDIRTGRR